MPAETPAPRGSLEGARLRGRLPRAPGGAAPGGWGSPCFPARAPPAGGVPKRPARPAAAARRRRHARCPDTSGQTHRARPLNQPPGSEHPPRRGGSTASTVSTQPRAEGGLEPGARSGGPQTPDRGAADGQARASGQQRGLPSEGATVWALARRAVSSGGGLGAAPDKALSGRPGLAVVLEPGREGAEVGAQARTWDPGRGALLSLLFFPQEKRRARQTLKWLGWGAAEWPQVPG